MPNRNELLADHYLRVAGIAAVYVDADGAIGTEEVVGIEIPLGRISFCCNAGDEVRLTRLAQACTGDQRHAYRFDGKQKLATIAARLEQLADDHGIGITAHRIAVQRALAAVQAVNQAIDRMQHNGGLKEVNRAFKAARKVDPAIRYFDYLHAHKAAMLEALAGNK
jgi:hypothetical protein